MQKIEIKTILILLNKCLKKHENTICFKDKKMLIL